MDNEYELANNFFMSEFEKFIKIFPNLRLHDDSFASRKIESGYTKYTYVAFVRLHARNGFKRAHFKYKAKNQPGI